MNSINVKKTTAPKGRNMQRRFGQHGERVRGLVQATLKIASRSERHRALLRVASLCLSALLPAASAGCESEEEARNRYCNAHPEPVDGGTVTSEGTFKCKGDATVPTLPTDTEHLTYRYVVVGEKGQYVLGLCGAFLLNIQWQMPNARPTDGFIVQHVQIDTDSDDPIPIADDTAPGYSSLVANACVEKPEGGDFLCRILGVLANRGINYC